MHIAGVSPLPTRLLSYTAADGELVPAWLSDRDRPWLRDQLLEAEAFCGRPFGELLRRWRQSECDPRAGRRQPMAVHVLSHWLRRCLTARPMTEIRQELFRLTAQGTGREQAFAQVASKHRMAPADLADDLFRDLVEHRLVRWPEPPPEPSRLSWSTNLALVRGLLKHAHAAEIRVHGASRALLKTAWLLGAAPKIASNSAGGTTISLCRDRATGMRALTALVQLLPWAQRYQLRADCQLGRDRGCLVVGTGDPILPGPEPRLYDSRLEQTFANDFISRMPDWQLLREPTAIATEHGLAFPDFELRPRNGGAAWLCELTGLRDPSALPRKLQLLTAHPRLVLCLPQRFVPDALRDHARLVPFRRRVCIDLVRSVIAR